MIKPIIIDGEKTNYTISDEGIVFNLKTNREVKGTTKRNEYKTVQLTINNKQKSLMVHRLVANAFLENPNNLPIVHHKDRDKLNNKLSNLEWVDYKDNVEEKTKVREKQLSIEKLENVVWKPLKINENYLVSNTGNVANKKTQKILNGTFRNGYKRVTIGNKVYSVHILVYETFKGAVHGVIDHIDGNKLNNNIDNLRDVSQSKNMKNAVRNGHSSQIKVQQLDNNFNIINEYPSFSEAARQMGVTYCAIKSAVDRNGKSCGYYWRKI